jgi:simple sugar transport system ATP-binding protein
VVANDGVDFDLRKGEVHALLGENGAGKSTLMNILYGLYHPDEGEFRLNGKPLRISSPREAIDAGIGMVHQHFMLIPVMTVAENIVLAVEPTKGPFIDEGAAEARVRELSERFGLSVRPDARIESISVGMQQRVEILKALYRGAEILILDEPTAVLTPQESSELFEIIESLKAEGKSIIFITHKLNEVLATEEGLARLMVGREVILRIDKAKAEPGAPLLTVEDLYVDDERGLEAVRGISFDVKAGEIVGIAGVDGNGQSELIDAITGLRRAKAGRIAVGQHDLTRDSPRERLDAGVGHIPEDRQLRGLVLDFSLAENIALHDYREEPDSKYGWLFPKRLVARARTLLKEFDVRGGGPETRASSLSGGNQQKVIVAREVSRDPSVLVAAQPTRGLDVGAIEFVHRRLVEERDEGRAILLVSFELDEILSLSDRILVIYEGQIVAQYSPDVSEEEIGFAMVGGKRKATAA